MHDVGGGGLAVALAEIAAVAGRGVVAPELAEHAELFAEFPGRFVLATSDPEGLAARARAAGVDAVVVGAVGGARLRLGDLVDLDLDEVAARRSGSLVEALSAAG